MPGDANGYEQVSGDVGINAVWQYNEISGETAGFGSLPLAGSFQYPTATPTTTIYNGYGFNNPDDVYPPASMPDTYFGAVSACPEGDICYSANAAPGMAPDDRSSSVTAFKKSFAGDEHVEGTLVLFYFPAGATGTDVGAMMDFANMWAGYGRGNVNGDDVLDLRDLCFMISYTTGNGPAPCPFVYLADVNCDGVIDGADATHMYNFMFAGGDPPMSKLVR